MNSPREAVLEVYYRCGHAYLTHPPDLGSHFRRSPTTRMILLYLIAVFSGVKRIRVALPTQTKEIKMKSVSAQQVACTEKSALGQSRQVALGKTKVGWCFAMLSVKRLCLPWCFLAMGARGYVLRGGESNKRVHGDIRNTGTGHRNGDI